MNNQSFDTLIARHNAFLTDWLKTTAVKAPRLQEALTYVLFPSGKRLRPLLVYLCGQVLSVDLRCLDTIAAAIELVHTYSLVHDDLPAMDNDDLRRGRPSCHKAFDEATAILVGDGLQSLAIDLLIQDLTSLLPPTPILRIVKVLVEASGFAGMVAGQSLDLTELSNPEVQIDTLQTVHALKTGALFLACVKMVLAICDVPPKTAAGLEQFATHLGFAFQMQDDYLDAYGLLNHAGKGRSSDQANCKRTFADCYPSDALQQAIQAEVTLAQQAILGLACPAQPLLDLVDFVFI